MTQTEHKPTDADEAAKEEAEALPDTGADQRQLDAEDEAAKLGDFA
jgi:hypothetical protein